MLRIIVAIALAAAWLPAAAQQMEPGEWQFDTLSTSLLFPKPQSILYTTCIRKEDISDPTRWMGNKRESDCKVTPVKQTADSFSWRISCPKTNTTGSGTVRYGRGTMEGDMQMAGENQGRKYELRTKMTGKRLGPCKNREGKTG